jgi:hypothetical protein
MEGTQKQLAPMGLALGTLAENVVLNNVGRSFRNRHSSFGNPTIAKIVSMHHQSSAASL